MPKADINPGAGTHVGGEFYPAPFSLLAGSSDEPWIPTAEELEELPPTKWDFRFLDVARLVSTWSKDPSTKCGAVIVRPDRSIASTGYNGFPRGCSDADEVYADRELKYSRVVHAELNALLQAREPVHGYTMYTYPGGIGPSCDRCSAHIIQAGIVRVVHIKVGDGDFQDRWADAVRRGLDMYAEAGVAVTSVDPEDYDAWHTSQ